MPSTHRSSITRVVVGYLVALLLGTALLMTPAATVADGGISLLSALFTATSSLSVTGLAVLDTGQDFTFFGQSVILFLIQVGGLGVLMLTMLLAMLVAGKVGLKLRQSAATETKSAGVGGIKPMVLRIVALTFASEFVIALVLFLRFSLFYRKPLGEALWHAVFHAISSFNNAGFGLESDSLMTYVSDPFICGPIAAGVIVGGLGYPVILELIRRYKFPLKWSMTTRIVVVVTPLLLAGGALFIAVIEWNNPATLGSLDWWSKVQAASFQSTITRTAGFNSIDIAHLHSVTWFGMDILMFIGAGPAGTAGGIKITTFAVVSAMAWAEITGARSVTLLGRRLSRSVHRQATTVVALALGLIVTSTMLIMLNAPSLAFDQILFEVISGFANVGLSTGITTDLPPLSRIVLITTMILGRLGPVTVASALALRQRPLRHELPKERPLIG